MRLLLSIMCCGLLLLGRPVLLAQEISEEREKVKERIEVIRMWKMMKVLDLTREQSERIFPLLERIEERRRMLFEERDRMMRDLGEVVRGEHPDEKAVVLLLGRLEENHEELEGLRREEKKSLENLLSPVQQGRYLIFKENFERELRSIIREAKNPLRPRPFEGPEESREWMPPADEGE